MPYADPERQADFQASWHQREKMRRNAAARARRRAAVALIRSLKEGRPCVDCGGLFPHYVLDFDHVRGEKLYELNHMTRHTYSRERILAEVAKCDLVCANCHRIRTHG